eukprot:Skav213693  [mRNA]  locus=scaffold491:617777:618118:+ [translate_table: standard]
MRLATLSAIAFRHGYGLWSALGKASGAYPNTVWDGLLEATLRDMDECVIASIILESLTFSKAALSPYLALIFAFKSNFANQACLVMAVYGLRTINSMEMFSAAVEATAAPFPE